MGLGLGIGISLGRGGSLSSSWVPTSLYGCALWLRADLGITKDGSDLISAWADQSGNGNDATQATGTRQPKYFAAVVNGKPTVRFDGGDDLATGNVDWSAVTDCTVFVVANPGAGVTATLVEKNVPVTEDIGIISGGATFYFTSKRATSGRDVRTLANPSNGAFRAFGIRATQASAQADEVQGFLDGAQQTLGGAGVDSSGAFSNSPFYIGARGGPSTQFTGDIAEVVAYARALTAAEVSALSSYFARRYAL